jgi:hypothetical protein
MQTDMSTINCKRIVKDMGISIEQINTNTCLTALDLFDSMPMYRCERSDPKWEMARAGYMYVSLTIDNIR